MTKRRARSTPQSDEKPPSKKQQAKAATSPTEEAKRAPGKMAAPSITHGTDGNLTSSSSQQVFHTPVQQPPMPMQSPSHFPMYMPYGFNQSTPAMSTWTNGNSVNCTSTNTSSTGQAGDMPAWAREFKDTILANINNITHRLKALDVIEASVIEIKRDVHSLNERVKDVEISQQVISDMCESNKKSSETLGRELSDLQSTLGDMTTKTKDLASEILDLKCRSMRDNLLFFNFPEASSDETEDCDALIRTFCENKLEFTDKLEIDDAHRSGRRSAMRPRPIVVKFRNFKQRECIRKSSHKLKDTNFSIGEQYPKEVQDRRREQLPVMKQAKAQGKRAHFVRDKLYIDGHLYTAPTSATRSTDNNR